MQIKCPNCRSILVLGKAKPGRFRPTCKHCGDTFLLAISTDEPPQVRVGKPPAVTSAEPNPATSAGPQPDSTGIVPQSLDAPVRTNPATHETIDHTVAERRDQTAIASVVQSPEQQDVNAGFTDASGDEITPVTDRMGGYRILRTLGRGAMGVVYEAKQVSLDRIVALKTIRGRLADNPASLARFTREAYAAAQLTHHNVVQIYDFGEQDGLHFFSMEWIRGGSLSELVAEKGGLEPKLAAGYALQAARGLQFAHANGMVHRDVKPANLLLSTEGVVKVADLGLVKVPGEIDPLLDVGTVEQSGTFSGTQVTIMGTAVGTPAYMAPEQGIDATAVDHRADIYSFGCTFYYLLTGVPPFAGSDSSQVRHQHANDPIPDAAAVNPHVPAALQNVITRSMEKQPDARYASLAEAIDDLESYLGIAADGDFSPSSDQADQWEAIASDFASAGPLARFITPAMMGYATICLVLTAVIPFLSLNWLAFGPALGVSGFLIAVIMGAGGRSDAILKSVRGWFGTLSWFDTLIVVVAAIVMVIGTMIAGMTTGAIIGLLLGCAFGVGFLFGLVKPTRQAKSPPLADAKRFVRDLRISGADEQGIRSFIARYSGRSWQSLYESLFGYPALVQMRQQLDSDATTTVPTGTSPRDWLISRINAKSKSNRAAKDHEQLAKIEQRGLQSQGLSESEARDRAWQMAAAVIDVAQHRQTPEQATPLTAQQTRRQRTAAINEQRRVKRDQIKLMLADARSGDYAQSRSRPHWRHTVLGGRTRFLVGCGLLIVFGLWLNLTGIVTVEQISSLRDSVSYGAVDVDSVAAELESSVENAKQTEPSMVVFGGGTSGWSIGVAGLVLCLSSFVAGWRMSLFAVCGVALILFGPLGGIPPAGPLPSWIVAAIAGVVIMVPGAFISERDPSLN